MQSFEDYFSKKAIIEVLCKHRLSKAKSLHDKRFQRKIVKHDKREFIPQLYEYFPPRKEWHRFRPRKAQRSRTGNHTLIALKRAIAWYEKNEPSKSWLIKLNKLVHNVQSRAFFADSFQFSAPTVRPELKSGNNYRAISSLSNLEDKIIDNLNAKYLRESLDVTFESSAVAFRGGEGVKFDRNHAIDKIIAFRDKYLGNPLYVTECDIRGFFDCVHHAVAKDALDRAVKLLGARNSSVTIDKRSRKIFEAYLKCYSFSNDVKKAESTLQRKEKNKKAVYKWPLENDTGSEGPYYLKYFYDRPMQARIGIPQGGAHSCLIANLILDLADKETLLALSSFDEDSLYLRFCDDIIILTQTTEAADKSFEVYTRSLEFLRLPHHKAVVLEGYGKKFFEESKTKVAFKWNHQVTEEDYPWVQFLGYQIRYDNYLRVRPSSIRKHKRKMENLYFGLRNSLKDKDKKVSSRRVLYRFNSKVWAFSSGRVNIYLPNTKPLPMCWCSGFTKLANHLHDTRQIRSLDKHVDKYRRRMKKFLKKSTGGAVAQKRHKHALRFYGSPFSHQRQFKLSN
ncbi:hypothetical protein [Rubritalea squalenifaciens]|nr:hypothetical protein [Rubritalea squalenifaciens]